MFRRVENVFPLFLPLPVYKPNVNVLQCLQNSEKKVHAMKTSTEINSAARLIGEQRAIEYIAQAGFDAWDFSMFRMANKDKINKVMLDNDHPLAGRDYVKFARQLKQVGLDNGIVCNQSHAPFPSDFPGMEQYLFRAIECTAEAGGQICVIHPCNKLGAEENAEMYAKLLPFAVDHGVMIATENMWSRAPDKSIIPAACSAPEDFCKHIDLLDSRYMVACLDIGHAEMAGLHTSAVEMIHALGHRLQALHLHDNNKRDDSHQIPFTMDIDFAPIVKALKQIGYAGYFTLEADAYLKAYTEETVYEGIEKLALSGKKLAEMFEKA